MTFKFDLETWFKVTVFAHPLLKSFVKNMTDPNRVKWIAYMLWRKDCCVDWYYHDLQTSLKNIAHHLTRHSGIKVWVKLDQGERTYAPEKNVSCISATTCNNIKPRNMFQNHWRLFFFTQIEVLSRLGQREEDMLWTKDFGLITEGHPLSEDLICVKSALITLNLKTKIHL